MSRLARLPRVHSWVYLWAVLVVPLVYGASFPLARVWWVGWIGFVPWFVAIRIARTTAGAVAICCVSTFLGSYACTPWLARAVADYYQQPLLLGVLLFAGVYVAAVGPYVVLFTLCFRQLARYPSRWLPLLTGAAWAGAELLRVRLLIGQPFGVFGYSQVAVTPLAQVADVTGVYGLTVLPLAFSTALAELWLAYSFAERTGSPTGSPPTRAGLSAAPPAPRVATVAEAWKGAALVAATVAAVLTYGFGRLATWDESTPGQETRIALVQGNLDLGSQWREEFYGRNLDEYMRLTLATLSEYEPRIVFWPESAMTFFLEDEPLYRRSLGSLLAVDQIQLVAGGPRAVGTPPAHFYNSAFLIGSDGAILAEYDKQQLLPFAEYFPFGGIELMRRHFARVRQFTPGGPARLLPTVAGPAGVVICNEVMFGEIVSQRVRAGASYLVTLTNDSWLGDAMYAEQAFDMARLRAVEQRRYLVRASTSGPSAIIDPLGRVVVQTATDTRATTGGTIRPRTGLTFYALWGDVFGMLCVLVPLAVLAGRAIGARSRLRGSGARSNP